MDRLNAYRGCLLGLAVGDAMGCTVDSRSWDQICRDYGPHGLLGYDLVNGFADVSSHTQLAAYTCNGLLMGLTRGQMRGVMAPYVRYIAASSREWAQCQRLRTPPVQTACWVSRVPCMRRRLCMDTRMLDTLIREQLGTPEDPRNQNDTPGSLTCAIPVGLFFNPDRMAVGEIGRLGAEAVALTHGSPLAFLSGAFLAIFISALLRQKKHDLDKLIRETMDTVQEQFGREYPQTVQLFESIRMAVALADAPQISPRDAMEQLRCETCPEVLAGALYACLVSLGDFDAAMIASVNHSGRSAAVGAVTGAILGAVLGVGELPDFYLECLESVDTLLEIAADMDSGCPMTRDSLLFDMDWDRKYVHGGV